MEGSLYAQNVVCVLLMDDITDVKIGVTPFPSIGLGMRTTTTTWISESFDEELVMDAQIARVSVSGPTFFRGGTGWYEAVGCYFKSYCSLLFLISVRLRISNMKTTERIQ